MAGRDGTHCFFFYGTLIDPDVRRLVLGAVPKGAEIQPAWLPGFTVRYVLRARYPAIMRKPGVRAPGLAVSGLSTAQAKLLDRYEGDGYRRETRLVRLSDRRQIAAQVYLPKAKLRTGPRLWSHESWRRRDKDYFLWASGLTNPRRRLTADSRARYGDGA